jgi:pimeloyl-ACP methyl ester carboxylesterase
MSLMPKAVKSIALIVVVLVAGAAATGAGYQAVGEWRDARRFPQHGRSVQAGKTRLNIDCSGDRSGSGYPVVILDSGIGVPAIGWIKVQPEVAKFARVCSYDRAGYGWSDPGPNPRTSVQIANELKSLLTAAGEKGPYVLVGHSFGGFNIRVYTNLFPADVLGLVLVDGAHEDEDKRIDELLPPAVLQQEARSDLWNARLGQFLTPLSIHLGIQRLQVATGWGSPSYGVLEATRSLPKEFRLELLYLRQTDRFRRAIAGESAAFAQSIGQVRAAGNLGDRPLIVLTAGIPYEPDPLLTKTEMEQQDNLWINVLQVQEAHLSTKGRQIIVPNSGHMIPFERPDTVVAAIREVWDTVGIK